MMEEEVVVGGGGGGRGGGVMHVSGIMWWCRHETRRFHSTCASRSVQVPSYCTPRAFFASRFPPVEFRCILRIPAMSEQADVLFKLIVIGDTGTGKSCLLHRFVEGK